MKCCFELVLWLFKDSLFTVIYVEKNFQILQEVTGGEEILKEKKRTQGIHYPQKGVWHGSESFQKDQEKKFENSNSTGAQEKKRGESAGRCCFSVIEKNKNEDCSHVLVLGCFPC